MLPRFTCCLIAAIFSSALLSAQANDPTSTGPGSPEAATRLQSSLSALAGKSVITDISLTGIAERLAGSDDETGRATFKALITGEESTEITFPSGTRRELRSGAGSTREGHWSGSDGAWHTVAEHNLKAEGVWFSPTLLVSQLIRDKARTFQHLGTAVIAGQSLEHIRAQHASPAIPAKAPEQVARLMQHLTELDLYLDPVSALPLMLTFNEHPDNDASRDIPVEIRFSDYRLVNGAQVPFRLQKFINGTLLLDVRVEQAILNSHLPANTFTAQ